MKIGTISFNINAPDFNYGAVLHSWAFLQYLGQLDCVEEAEIINYTMPVLEGQHLAFPLIDAVVGFHFRQLLHGLASFHIYKRRYKKFRKFENKNMIISKARYTQDTLNYAKLSYDCVICESDVIWSPGFSGGHFDKSFFLALDSMKNMRRIAYAPSMGDGNLTKIQEEELEALLHYPEFISCRESYAKLILEKHTAKKVVQVIDPVMLLDTDDYAGITGKRILQKDYIFLYMPANDNIKLRLYAKKYANQHGLAILEISTKLHQHNRGIDICLGAAGIEEFLSAIKYAKVVFTNSFHAVCFSIIFQVDFYAFSRDYAGKVEDVCKTFGLEERFLADDTFSEREPINYLEVEEKWEMLKAKSKDWLEWALRGGKTFVIFSLFVHECKIAVCREGKE